MSTIEKPATAPEIRRVVLAPIEGMEWRESGSGKGEMTVAGHAAVFNRLSLDLGGFREKIAPDAFNNVLDRAPDVHLVWDHDTSLVLARTRNKTLDLRVDPLGLHFWARVAPTSYAEDLRILMERGDIDQASFAFTVAEDEWHIDEDEEITRTITRVADLYDVTITAQGAYPQTDSSLRSLLQEAIAQKRLPDLSVGRALEIAAPEEADETETEPPQAESLDGNEENSVAQEEPADVEEEAERLEALRARRKARKRMTKAEVAAAKTNLLDLERGKKA